MRGRPAPGWRLEGGSGVLGPFAGPHYTLAACRSGRDPHCVLSLPLPGRGHRGLSLSSLLAACGLQASWLCNYDQGLAALRPCCASDTCVPRVPEALPGLEWRSRFPLDSRLVPAVPSPPLDGIPDAVPWVHRACGQGGRQVGVLSRGAAGLGLGSPSGPLRTQTGRFAASPWGWGPLGRLPGLGAPQGQNPGSCHAGPSTSHWIQQHAGCLLGLHFRCNVS